MLYICTNNNSKAHDMITLNYNQSPSERVEILKENREDIIEIIRSYSSDSYHLKNLMSVMLKAAQDNQSFLSESSDEPVLSLNNLIEDYFDVIGCDNGIAQQTAQLDQHFSDERARVMQQYSRKFS